MGMNIYTVDGIHVGKRYAAGIWCWDCLVPLNGNPSRDNPFPKPMDKCPSCGAARAEKPGYDPASRELGFSNPRPRKHTGIDGASGFIWQTESKLGNTRDEVYRAMQRRRYVLTEYGEKWPIKKFWEMFKDVIEVTDEPSDFS